MTPSDPRLPAPPVAAPGSLPAPLSTRRAVHVAEARRTSPRTVALEALALVGVGLGIIVAVLSGAGTDVVQLWFGLAAILYRLLGWWFRTYTVTDGELLLDEGILQRRHRVVPFTRIQQVELRQQLLARLLGLTIVQVETAGDASATAVVLRYLELPEAEALRDHLLAQQRRARGSSEAMPATGPGDLWRPAAVPNRVPLVRLRAAQLLGAGATSSGAVGAGSLAVVVVGVTAAARGAAEGVGPLMVLAQWGAVTLLALAAIGLLFALATLVHSWAYELATVGDDLHVTFGLLDRRQHTIPRHRLQHLALVDNPVRRRLGFVSVRLHSGATPGHGEDQSSHIEVPAVRASQVDELLERAMGSDRWRTPPVAPRPRAARRRAIVRRSIPTAALGVLGAAAWWPAGAALLPAALVGIPWGLVAHRRAGWSFDGSLLAFSSGALVHHLELIPRERVQSIRTTASPWQRRLALRTLRIDVAGGAQHPLRGAAGLMDLDECDAGRAAAAVVATHRPAGAPS